MLLLQPIVASLEMLFYDGAAIPRGVQGETFAAEHGSWNRQKRRRNEVIRAPVHGGQATGDTRIFLTGFVTADATRLGRPVGVAVARTVRCSSATMDRGPFGT